LKIYNRRMIARGESITGWTDNEGGTDVALNSDAYEGRYGIFIDPLSDGNYVRFTPAASVDLTYHTTFEFWVRDNSALLEYDLILKVYTDVNNYGEWDFSTSGATYTKISKDLTSPDRETGTLDISDITYIEWESDGGVNNLDLDYVYATTGDIIAKVFSTDIFRGIFPYPSTCQLGIDPDNTAQFSQGDFILVQDDSSNDAFYGKIIDVSVDVNGVTYGHAIAFTNELLKMHYTKSYSSDNSEEKLEDILDNKASFCYDSSLTAEALDYDYEQDGNVRDIINLFRFLERIVIYTAVDGATTTKAYDSLTASGENWDQDDNDVTLLDYMNPTLEIYGAEVEGSRASSIDQSYTVAASEGAYGEQRMIKWRDIKIMEAATALQLATNLYNIFSAETQFIKLYVEGKGVLQPGESVVYAHSDYGISSTTAMILYYHYDAYNDIYREIMLTDNIATIGEFNSYGGNLKSAERNEAMIYDVADLTSTVTSDLATHEALEETAHGGNLCRIATGTYTGNGNNNREITGLGFDPKYVIIWYSSGGNMWQSVIHEDAAAWTDFVSSQAAATNRVELITDGFEVNNNHASDQHNTNAVVYYYIALG
jgi:hypothetical protein